METSELYQQNCINRIVSKSIKFGARHPKSTSRECELLLVCTANDRPQIAGRSAERSVEDRTALERLVALMRIEIQLDALESARSPMSEQLTRED